MIQIWYVHGAGASPHSFNWLQDKLPKHTARFITYKLNEYTESVAERLYKLIDEPCVIIGHSLGGIVTMACAGHPMVEKVVTLCAPFGGVRHAEFMSMFSFEPLFHDMRSHGPLLRKVRNRKIDKPHLAIVGTNGLPFTTESNDGVLTVASQMAFDTPYEMLPLNHFEVLLSPQVAELITTFLR